MSDSQLSEQRWRWPNDRNFSPTVLKTYGQCPSRVKMQYLQKLPAPEKFVPFFASGNAAHSALSTIAQQMRDGAELITEDQIRNLARFHMPEHEYPSPEYREAEIQKVLKWVSRGRAWLESMEVMEWLRIEKFERRDFSMFHSQAPYKMITRPDLVLKRMAEDGQPYFHIIDWKTGAVWEEHDVPVIMRFALRERLDEWVNDANAANVVFTWNWLEHDVRKDVDVSMEHVSQAWPDIVSQMRSLALESEWTATPGRHCVFCPYYKNFCPEEIPPELD